jgi:cytochrome c oxidase subunit 2
MIWTVIPAIVLTSLVVVGIYRWLQITGANPPDARVIEITGKQFNWLYRYPGADNELGPVEFAYTSSDNLAGIDFNQKSSHDDFMPLEMHVEVGKPVMLRIRALDVIHNVGIPFFRVKMDAIPGITNRFVFTPTATTAEMREKTGNPDFNFEIACDQLCGRGHFSMRGLIVVDSPEEFKKWQTSQVSYYESQIKGKDAEKSFHDRVAEVKKKAEEKKKGSHGHGHDQENSAEQEHNEQS